MSDTRLCGVFSRTLALLAVCAAIPLVAHAQARSVAAPEHASANTYGSGWACDSGYQRSGEGCAAIALPLNAHLTAVSFGSGWECNRGFQTAEQSSALRSPCRPTRSGASGDRWPCDRGYRKNADRCISIDVPAQAYLNTLGDGWECGRGYHAAVAGRAVAGAAVAGCVAINVPANGYLTNASYGSGWACDRGYRVDDVRLRREVEGEAEAGFRAEVLAEEGDVGEAGLFVDGDGFGLGGAGF